MTENKKKIHYETNNDNIFILSFNDKQELIFSYPEKFNLKKEEQQKYVFDIYLLTVFWQIQNNKDDLKFFFQYLNENNLYIINNLLLFSNNNKLKEIYEIINKTDIIEKINTNLKNSLSDINDNFFINIIDNIEVINEDDKELFKQELRKEIDFFKKSVEELSISNPSQDPQLSIPQPSKENKEFKGTCFELICRNFLIKNLPNNYNFIYDTSSIEGRSKTQDNKKLLFPDFLISDKNKIYIFDSKMYKNNSIDYSNIILYSVHINSEIYNKIKDQLDKKTTTMPEIIPIILVYDHNNNEDKTKIQEIVSIDKYNIYKIALNVGNIITGITNEVNFNLLNHIENGIKDIEQPENITLRYKMSTLDDLGLNLT